jgi:hypothetical protein
MTKSDNPKPAPLPLLLVYGKPTSADLPQASWFRIEDRAAVAAAAHALKFAVVDIAAEEDRKLLVGVHEGVLKAGGRLIVGSVLVDVYNRIEEHAAQATAVPSATTASDAAATPTFTSEQTKNTTNKPSAAAASDPWSELQIGSHVIAKYWEANGDVNGWWLGKITGFEKKDFVIVWLDDPKLPPLKTERKYVAILHPSFDPKTEWDRKR